MRDEVAEALGGGAAPLPGGGAAASAGAAAAAGVGGGAVQRPEALRAESLAAVQRASASLSSVFGATLATFHGKLQELSDTSQG